MRSSVQPISYPGVSHVNVTTQSMSEMYGTSLFVKMFFSKSAGTTFAWTAVNEANMAFIGFYLVNDLQLDDGDNNKPCGQDAFPTLHLAE